MKLAVMQPYFFPYLGYFQCIHAVDTYILYGNLSYRKEGWMHRNRILSASHKTEYITAKVQGKSSNTLIKETMFFRPEHWKEKLIRTLETTYARAEFFEEIFPVLSALIQSDHKNLHNYNAATIMALCEFLEIETTIEADNTPYVRLEQELAQALETQYENLPHLQKTCPDKKGARVLELCHRKGATCFVNASGGKALYSKEEFAQYGIELVFIETNIPPYPQWDEHPFVPDLSIIDVLFHNGKKKTQSLITNYTLV